MISVRLARSKHILRRSLLKRCVAGTASSENTTIPNRKTIIKALKAKDEFDVLVIGGGATGAGAALDAALRGLKVACVEREDFSSGTSSRSTKLIWAGSRYLVQACVELLSTNLVKTPVSTIKKFIGDFKMVLNCHKERRFLMDTQPHLTNWLALAVPMTSWILWPPPFNFAPAAIGPLGMFTAFFKFYDSLCGFTCPPSHVMLPARAKRKFPQLANNNIKYCSVFYEGQHDDSRTNLAIAQTAAREGAAIANYCNVVRLLHAGELEAVAAATSTGDKPKAASAASTSASSSSGSKNNKIVAAEIRDEVTGETFIVRAKSILFAGGPFTDQLRALENPQAKKIVNGAGGIHIVLPQYYAPSGIGLVDMNTSDGRFLFFLPWEGHVLVGTTDHKQEASMRPEASELEIRWVLAEASKYLNPELRVRREDVLSAWSGIRPLVLDPDANEVNTKAASRDHNISHNPDTGIVYVAGGKWVTYREMAEDAVDKIIEVSGLKQSKPCSTLHTPLVGRQGYSPNLPVRLDQDWGVDAAVAQRLTRAYGGRAADVLKIAREDLEDDFKGGKLLVPGFPYLEAEVVFAVRHDWAEFADDIIARRTRLAFLNKDIAIGVIPKVIKLMAKELRWSEQRQEDELDRCIEYMRHFGGPRPAAQPSPDLAQAKDADDELKILLERGSARVADTASIRRAFHCVDFENRSKIDRVGVRLMGEVLGHPLLEEEVSECILCTVDARHAKQDSAAANSTSVPVKVTKSTQTQQGGGSASVSADGGITLDEFTSWWNHNGGSSSSNKGATKADLPSSTTPPVVESLLAVKTTIPKTAPVLGVDCGLA